MKNIITNGSAVVLMQNTEATQILVHTGHNAYEERKLPVASTPSVLYSLPSREIREWTSVMMPDPGGMRADPNLQPDSRILWWLGGCKQVWWDSGAGLGDNDQFGGYDSKSTSQSPVPICPDLSWLSSFTLTGSPPIWAWEPRRGSNGRVAQWSFLY